MMRAKLLELVEEYSAADWRRANEIHVILGQECERLAARGDRDAFDLLVSLILIDSGTRRKAREIWQLFPVLHMLVGDRDGMRVADMLTEDFELQRRKTA